MDGHFLSHLKHSVALPPDVSSAPDDVIVLQLRFHDPFSVHDPCSVHVMATVSATMTVQELLQVLLMMKIRQMNDICMTTIHVLIITY